MIKCWSKFHIQILWYSFTRQNRFPLTPSQSFSGKQENPSSSASRHVNNSVCMYFFHDSEFFSQTCISYHAWLQKRFKFMVLRLLENILVSQKTESVYPWSQAKLSSRFLLSQLQVEGNYRFPPNKVFWKSIYPQQGRQDYRAENMTKIKLARVLVASFDKFHYLQPLHFWFLFCCTII